MSETLVRVFFYGSYINFDVLREVEIVPERWEVARLHGFDIVIQPRANVRRIEPGCVYGIATFATHRQLERLYAHSRDVLGEVYLPEAVLVESGAGQWQPVLCYIAPEMRPRPAESAYLDRILAPARAFGFPDGYLARLESFRG